MILACVQLYNNSYLAPLSISPVGQSVEDNFKAKLCSISEHNDPYKSDKEIRYKKLPEKVKIIWRTKKNWWK
jgi:hypothetical protein